MKKSTVVAALFSSLTLICSIVLGPSISASEKKTDVAYVESSSLENTFVE